MKTIFAFLIFLSCAFAQDGRYGTSTGTSGGITTVTAREKTGWTSNGTTAQDTLATHYLINGKNHRLSIVDTDNDSLILAPHALYPINLKDGTTVLFQVDSTGKVGIMTAPNPSYTLTNSVGGMLSKSYEANIGSSGTANTLVLLQNTGSGDGTGAAINIFGALVRGVQRSSVVDLELVANTNGRVSLIPGASGSVMIGQAAATQAAQAFVTIRTQTPTADTLFMARNDKNATLDSTILIHANANLQSASRAGFGVSTSGQATRAALNVASRAGADTVVVVTSESNYGLGDSTLYVHGNANVQSGARAGFGVNTSGQAARAILNAASRAGDDSLLVLTAESNYGVGDSSIIVHGDAVMQSGARAGFGAATKGQATRAYLNVLRRSGADTLALLIGDGDGAPGDSTMMVFADGSYQFGVTAGGANAFSGTAEHDTVTVSGASVNDIYTVTIKGAAAPAAADLFAVEALSTGFAVHRSAAGTSGLEYYWRRERR